MDTYRYDSVRNGKVTLTIERGSAVVERKCGTPSEMAEYRKVYYPNTHNYRAHFPECGEAQLSECQICSSKAAH